MRVRLGLGVRVYWAAHVGEQVEEGVGPVAQAANGRGEAWLGVGLVVRVGLALEFAGTRESQGYGDPYVYVSMCVCVCVCVCLAASERGRQGWRRAGASSGGASGRAYQ